MNSNNTNKVKDFFKREGFYFILFICLCVVAVVAAFTIKNNNSVSEENKPNNEFTLNIEDENSQETSRNEMQNADRVENNNESEIAQETSEVQGVDEVADNGYVDEGIEIAEEYEDTAVSAEVTTVMFQLPLDGTIAREYKQMVRLENSENGTLDRTRRGIDVTAAVGTIVMAAADGTVSEISKSTEEGNFIVIEHGNGMITKYSNLNEEVNVAVGDNVTAGQEIGTIGNSSMIFTSDICGDVLNLQMQDAEGNQVNPVDYFSF